MERAALRFTIGMLTYAFLAIDAISMILQSVQHLELQHRDKYLTKEWALLMVLIYFPVWLLLADNMETSSLFLETERWSSTLFNFERLWQICMVVCYTWCVIGKYNSSGLSLASLTVGVVAAMLFNKDHMVLIICSSFAINVLIHRLVINQIPIELNYHDLRSFLLDENLDNGENIRRDKVKCGYHKKQNSFDSEEILTVKLLSDTYEAPSKKSNTFETSEDGLMEELNSLKSSELHQRVDQISKASPLVCSFEKPMNLEKLDSCADTLNFEFAEVRRALASIISEFAIVFGFKKEKVICKVSNEIHSFYYLGADQNFNNGRGFHEVNEMMKFNIYAYSVSKKPLRSIIVPKNDLYKEMGCLKLGLLEKEHSSNLPDSTLTYRKPKSKLKFDFTLKLEEDFYTCLCHTKELSPKSYSQATHFTDECIADENVNNSSICISAPHETQATNTISSSCKTLNIMGTHPSTKKMITRLKSHQNVSAYEKHKTSFY